MAMDKPLFVSIFARPLSMFEDESWATLAIFSTLPAKIKAAGQSISNS